MQIYKLFTFCRTRAPPNQAAGMVKTRVVVSSICWKIWRMLSLGKTVTIAKAVATLARAAQWRTVGERSSPRARRGRAYWGMRSMKLGRRGRMLGPVASVSTSNLS